MARTITPEIRPHRRRLNRRMLAGASAAALLAPLLAAGSAQAVQFNRGELTGSFDTTLTLGALFRVQDRDESIIARVNGGTFNSHNGDNGNLNYDKGLVSLTGRALHELKLNYRNLGAFVRATYFYDVVNADKDSTDFARTGRFPLDGEAVERVGRDFKLLDALVYGNFSLGDDAGLDVRLGNQVLSWGESTFIANGINTINPIDVSALRIPGSELKESFLPVPIADVSLSLGHNFSLEAFYQFKWDQTEPEAANSFFSTTDSGSPGARYLLLGFGNPLIPDIDRSVVNAAASVGSRVPRLEDDQPSDSGQFGFAARYFSPDLGNTEFGAYYINYHSRLPVLETIVGTQSDFYRFAANPQAAPFSEASGYRLVYPEDIQLFGLSLNTTLPAGISFQAEYSFRKDQPLALDDVELLQSTFAAPAVLGAAASGQTAGQAAAQSQYQAAVNRVLAVAAPSLVGTSFTSLPGAVQGQVQAAIASQGGPASYAAALQAGAQAGALAGARQAAALFNQYPMIQRLGGIDLNDPVTSASRFFGSTLQGYEFFDISQLQFTATKAFGPMVGADQWVLLGEFGFNYVHGFPGADEYRLDGPGTDRSYIPAFAESGAGGAAPGPAVEDGFATRFSWGYRMTARFDYLNAFSGVNLSPSISWQHDVNGVTPGPIGNFVEGRKALSFGLRALYLEKWTADISYSTFFGAGQRNLIRDRDFVSVSVKYSF
ncbi:DUF1302 domain-containing protein [Rhodospirillum centenum]|uniref:DUF1302 domain-containing protein n=1 Tax=Rhodospirillum centenum (strain ATCC 51521 / SW) TaxID=414684 RepID=B6IWY0_RHOCS|nr:DUF1302 domain-containing protein [Rhodospirillum centenum]ACJ00804.1 conserved hypothetical protein [Rhodospirillum centenum SW]